MSAGQESLDDMSQDLDLVRTLIQKYGVRGLNSMMTVASLRGSTVSASGQSFISGSGTSVSRATTSSSFYPESMSTGRDSLEAHAAQWQPTSNPISTTYPMTPIESPLPLSVHALIPDSGRDTETDASTDGSTTRHHCPFCAELGIDNGAKRKSDLKRHFNLHALDCQWVCKFQIGNGCNASFDFHAAYEDHVKKEHNGFKDLDAKVNLCRQVVWACGAQSCREVFEASSDAEAKAVRKAYVNHVLSHLSTGTQFRWSYSRRMRDLLGQTATYATWKEYSRGMDGLTWHPESSSRLRKILECRHLVDIPLLCSYAVSLGSSGLGFAPPVPPLELKMPLLDECTIVTACHHARRDSRFIQGDLEAPQQVPTLNTNRSLAVPRPCPAMQSPASFTSHPQPPTSGLYHELPPPSMTLASQSLELGVDAMEDADDLIMFPIHKPLEYFVGSMGDGPMDEQIGPFMESSSHTLPSRLRTSSRRHLLARKSKEKLRAMRNSADGDCRMMDVAPPMPIPTMPQANSSSSTLYMSDYDM